MNIWKSGNLVGFPFVPFAAYFVALASSVAVEPEYLFNWLDAACVWPDIIFLICVTKASSDHTNSPQPPLPPTPKPLTSDYCSASSAFPCRARCRAHRRRIPSSFNRHCPFANCLSPVPRFPIRLKRLPRVIRSLTVCLTSRHEHRADSKPGSG